MTLSRILVLAGVAALAFSCALGSYAKPLPPFNPGTTPNFNPSLPFPVDLPPLSPIRCLRLSTLSLAGATVTAAEVVPAGSYHPPGTPSDFILSALPKFCRVAGTATPTGNSIIKFEVWVPFDGSYRNRYLQTGNGGFSGAIVYGALADGIKRGYAAASTDDGNQVLNNAAFAVGHPEKVIDYGYRALKQTTDKAKAIIRALTGHAPERSYFHGCSNGGREALMEAQRYPDDFDGIVVGAPANYFTHQFASFAWNAQQIYPPVSLLPRLHASRLAILSAAVRAQCAGHDGGLPTDRYLTNPLACHVDFAPMTCTGSSTAGCLTPAEVGIIQTIYAGPVHTATHMQIYPGLEPGAESHPLNWPLWITGLPKPDGTSELSVQAFFGSQFFGYFVHGFWPFDLRTMNFSTDIDHADALFGGTLNSIDADLRRFYDRGGKLIQYHGFDDDAVAPKNSINYWASVEARMRDLRPGFSRAQFDNFYRLFMVPGMGHCALGDGATEFGNAERGSAMDATHDVMLAMERWVETGVAPERIVARHRSPDFERPLCPYPKLPRYTGLGEATVAANWSCAVPARVIPVRPRDLERRPPFRVPIPDPAPFRKPGQ